MWESQSQPSGTDWDGYGWQWPMTFAFLHWHWYSSYFFFGKRNEQKDSIDHVKSISFVIDEYVSLLISMPRSSCHFCM
jgi:hypothetical protein